MTFLTTSLLISLAAAASAFIAVAAHAGERRSVVYVFKPLTIGLLLLLVASGPSRFASPYVPAILAGLLFSLVGDIFLMLPSDHFRSGLSSFLLAHVCYIFAFLSDAPFASPLAPYVVGLGLGGGAVAALWKGIPVPLRLPVLAYVTILLVMASQATSRALNLHTASAARASLGAVLFLLSDGLLAWARFRRPFPAAKALVHGTYFPAQWLIAISTFFA